MLLIGFPRCLADGPRRRKCMRLTWAASRLRLGIPFIVQSYALLTRAFGTHTLIAALLLLCASPFASAHSADLLQHFNWAAYILYWLSLFMSSCLVSSVGGRISGIGKKELSAFHRDQETTVKVTKAWKEALSGAEGPWREPSRILRGGLFSLFANG